MSGAEDDVLNHERLDELRQIIGSGPEGVGGIIDSFLEEADQDLGRIQDAAASGELEELASAAHRLKGTSRSLGATGVSERCASLEHDAREGAVDDLDARVGAIEEALTLAMEALEAEREA